MLALGFAPCVQRGFFFFEPLVKVLPDRLLTSQTDKNVHRIELFVTLFALHFRKLFIDQKRSVQT